MPATSAAPSLLPHRPRPLLILGKIEHALDYGLRRVLAAKEAKQGLMVLDYNGWLTPLLSDQSNGDLRKSTLTWCDLANKRRPLGLFRFGRSPHTMLVLRFFLLNLTRLLKVEVSKRVLDEVALLAYRLTDQGTVGLVAWVMALQRPELIQPQQWQREDTLGHARVVAMLQWCLRFPSVWSISEGENPINMTSAVAAGGIVWVEIPSAHVEKMEHKIMVLMLDAVVHHALLDIDKQVPIVLCAAPWQLPQFFKAQAKQVGIFSFAMGRSTDQPAHAWVRDKGDCWVLGTVGEIKENTSQAMWLSPEQVQRLRTLEDGEVWVRSGETGKATTVKIRPWEQLPLTAQVATRKRNLGKKVQGMSHFLRQESAAQRKKTSVIQFSSAYIDQAPQKQNTDLYPLLCLPETLMMGWFRVKSGLKSSHGLDGVTIAQFGESLDAELWALSRELTEKRYAPRPLKNVRIAKESAKGSNEMREIKVACLRDRVVHAACLHLIEPLFDRQFSNKSFAFRQGRSAHQAIALARSAIRAGKCWAVVADIRKCFDTLDHEVLMRLFADVIADVDVCFLIRQWITTDVIDFMSVFPMEIGVPQGVTIAPLLANMYLNPLDKELEKAGVTFVRYADDFLVLCESKQEAEGVLALMSDFLMGALRLSLKPAKTGVHQVQQGVPFLGFVFSDNDVWIPAEKIAQLQEKLHVGISTLLDASALPHVRWQAGQNFNALIRGFRNYFQLDQAPTIQNQLIALDAQLQTSYAVQFEADDSLAFIWHAKDRFYVPSDTVRDESAQALNGTYMRLENAALAKIAPSQIEWKMQAPEPTRLASATTPNHDTADDAQAVGVFLHDGRLHIQRNGAYVGYQGDDLVVKRRKQLIFQTPLCSLCMVYLEGMGLATSADLTMKLCALNIPIIYASLTGPPGAITQSIVQTTRSDIRQMQVLRRDAAGIIGAGLSMLGAKVANQAAVLKYFARYRKNKPNEHIAYNTMTDAADKIRVIAKQLEALDPQTALSRSQWMGMEGQAAGAYWTALKALIPEKYAFSGRQTLHAVDPINSAINYVYALIYGEVWRAIARHGLDPYFGIIHGRQRDQGSLVFDVIEEYRAPFGDRTVLGLLGRGFDIQMDNEQRLTMQTRNKLAEAFYRQWQKPLKWRDQMVPPAEILDMQVALLKKTFLDEATYRGFKFKW